MVTIKGPMKIKMNGKTISDLVLEKITEPSLPFTATGWKSEKNQELVTGLVKANLPTKKPNKSKYKKVKK